MLLYFYKFVYKDRGYSDCKLKLRNKMFAALMEINNIKSII